MSIRYFAGIAAIAVAFAPAIVEFSSTVTAVAYTCLLLAAGVYLLLEE